MHCAKISRADQKMTPPPWVLDYDTLELSKQVDQLIIGEKLGEPGVAMRRKPGGDALSGGAIGVPMHSLFGYDVNRCIKRRSG